MLQGVGKVMAKSESGDLRRVLIYVPANVAKDSRFPFKGKEEVVVSIDGETLTIKRPPTVCEICGEAVEPKDLGLCEKCRDKADVVKLTVKEGGE